MYKLITLLFFLFLFPVSVSASTIDVSGVTGITPFHEYLGIDWEDGLMCSTVYYKSNNGKIRAVYAYNSTPGYCNISQITLGRSSTTYLSLSGASSTINGKAWGSYPCWDPATSTWLASATTGCSATSADRVPATNINPSYWVTTHDRVASSAAYFPYDFGSSYQSLGTVDLNEKLATANIDFGLVATNFEITDYAVNNYPATPGKHDFAFAGSFSVADVPDTVDICVLDVYDASATYKRYLASVFVKGVNWPSGYSISTASFPQHQTAQNYEYAVGNVRDFTGDVTVTDDPYTDFEFAYDYKCYSDIQDDVNQATATAVNPPTNTGTAEGAQIGGDQPTPDELDHGNPCSAEGLSFLEQATCRFSADAIRILKGFFIPPDNHAWITSMNSLQLALSTHTPVAYIVPFMDFTISPISSIPPQTSGLSFKDPEGNTVYIDLAPGTPDQLNPYWYIRTLMAGLVYFMLLIYFKLLYKRIFDHK